MLAEFSKENNNNLIAGTDQCVKMNTLTTTNGLTIGIRNLYGGICHYPGFTWMGSCTSGQKPVSNDEIIYLSG